MEFIFGGSRKTPRPDKSIIFKEHKGSTSTLVEIDLSNVEERLDFEFQELVHNKTIDDKKEYVKAITKAVVHSMWRVHKWGV